MTRKTLALLLAYVFLASSMWSLTADGFRAIELRKQANWHAVKSMHASEKLPSRAGLSNASSSTTPTSPLSAALPVLNSAIAGAASAFDGGSSSCTVHSSQPSSDSDDGDNDQGYSTYARHDYKYGSNDQASGVTPAVVASGVTIFGPQTFVRTTGPPNEFDSTVTVPAWIAQPFYLHVQNGDSSGNHRVSSGAVAINGVTLLGPSDFNQQVASADCAITLTSPTSALHIELASKPGSFLTINLLGQNQDHTPPALNITAPVSGSTVNTTTPHIALTYNDVKGATEPAASGVNVPSLKVLLDGIDRTNLFTERPNDASADLPASLALAQGSHTITASIQDNAGNTATATSQFQVATQSTLAIQVIQPVAGAVLNTLTVPVQITYSDNISINTSSLKVTVNGVDRTSSFTVTANSATGTITGQQGANQVVASISDVSAKQATVSVAFNIDTVPPVITILHPTPGSTHGSSAVEYSVQYSDDQALDLTSLKISVDGTPVPVTPTATTASGTVTLADGNHTLTASIKDKAGNQASASSTFSVDTTAPSIHITQPAPGAIQNIAGVQVQVQYGDNENINTSSLKIAIDGVDQTSFFAVTSTSASASLPGPFGEGSHTITAQIADQTGNVGQTSSTFVVDTIKPVLTIVSPIGPINTVSPSALAQYSDSGTGINTSSVHVFVDGSDVTAGFSVGNASVTGTLAGLSEGTHQLRVTVADRAGNVADQSVSFLVDITPPAISFTAPVNNSFINNTQPSVTLNYSDSGAGINQASIHIFLQTGSNPETEITSSFTLGASQATGTIGTPTALVPGTYNLRAQVLDNAGNSSGATSAFQVDTQPPTYTIQLPAANSFINTATPALLVTYQDDSSGVDPSKFAIRVDGVDRTNRVTVTATGASGTLLAGDALPDGTHQVEVTVVDRAGNSAPIVPQSFLVDTIPPAISISAPANGAYTNNKLFPISVSYSDSGSGIDITKFQLTIDGVDQTAQFTATATGATGVPAAVLLDGLHTVTATIKDLAGNLATATATIIVDTVAPQITITQPANGAFTNAATLVVTGSVVAASPVTVTVEGTPVPVQNNTFTSAGITLGNNATQLIHVVATDAAGNSSTVTLTVNIDRTPPTVTGVINPPPNAAGWNNTAVIVSFTCTDSGSGVATCPAPVPVTAEGANQAVTGAAVDNAGNTAQATVTVNIDKTPPVITGTPAPAPNAANWNTTDVTITYVCSDNLSGVVLCPVPKTVSTEGKAQPVTATVSDVAGNTATSTVVLNIEKTAPSITARIAPPPNAAGWNNTNVTASFLCTPSASDIVSCQTPIAVTTEGKGQVISGTVTDQAGKSNTTTATVNIDKTPPLINSSVAPPPNAAGWNNTDVIISYLCSDSLSGIAICPAPVTVSTEGAAESFTGQATDQAGNTSAVSTTLNIDKTPPLVTATAAPAPNGAGWNNTNVTVTFSCTDSLSGVANCPTPQLVASEGQNQNISGQATDIAGNVGTGSISLSIDKTPPTIVQLSTPDHVSRLHAGQVSVVVNDNFTVSQVVISVNGTSLGTFTSAPYQAVLQVPSGANPGDTLTVTALATDEAGNTQSASRAVRVAADGVIVGQVLSDATSFPIQGAAVQTISTAAVTDQSDDHGRYSLQASDSHLFLTASSAAPATTTVEREVFVQDGVGTVPVDVRLTPLSSPVAIGSAGGTLAAGNVSITVPAGAVGDGTTFQLTPLSGQGLPGLLPLGWSPVAAFDFRASSSAMNLPVAVSQLPNTVLHLATYNPALHAWTMVATNLQAVSGNVAVVLPSSGAYALVVPDVVTPPITVPDPGSALPGIPMQLLDPAASSSGSLSPAILPPSGGTSTATLGVQTASAVPSGTVIQANVSETFSLTSGDVVSEETRSEDIVIYNALAPANSTLGAQFAVAPSHKYTNTQLLTGKVHLDILAGREGVRGQPGGSDPLTLSDGIATLAVPGGALSQDTAIAVQGVSLENFVPTNGSLGALQEVLVDFSGETLNTPGQLSISSTGLNPAHTFLLTQVQRIDGVPHIVLVALAQINGASLTSVASPGLPGITQGGEYVFYDASAPLGFVQGVASSSAGPVQALVQTDSLPIVSITGANGQYIVPAIAGAVNLTATSPHTNLTGSASVQVTARQTTQTNISLTGTVTNAVVSPADGTLGVPVSTTITITTTAALNPQSISQANLVLLQGNASTGTPVPVGPFVLSSSGMVLSFAPVSNLNPATQYTIQVAGLADTFGGAVVVPVSSFTTKAAAALNFNPNAITFSFPDANGNITVSAPAGSLPAGTKVLIIDQSSGLVLSLTALNDGSVSGNFPGTINDILQVTVTDPTGATTSFTRSQFVAADGSVAVGPGGGTITGSGGVAMIIPQGALDKGVTFKVEAFGPDLFPERPNVPGGNFGGGLKITSPGSPAFKKEVKVAFPMPPDAPPGAFFQVFSRMHTPDNSQVTFEDVDFALPQGQGSTAQVVTASFPYRGLIDLNMLLAQADFQGQVLDTVFSVPPVAELGLEADMYLIWMANDALPGISLGGSITGRVRYAVAPGGTLPDGTINKTGDNVFVGVSNAFVTVDSNPPSHAVPAGATGARTQPDGSFTFSDPNYNGGTVKVIAYDGNGDAVTTTAAEVVALTDKTVSDFAGPLLKYYRNVAFADMVVPAPAPPPPTPKIAINLFTLDQNGLRVPANGLIADKTPLIVAFKVDSSISQPPNVTINGAPYATQPDIPDVSNDLLKQDFELTDKFVSSGPGIYKIVATGITAFLQTVTSTRSFLVVAAGGSNNDIKVGIAPEIVSTTPAANAEKVSVDTFVQVLFSEPVTNIPGNISLIPDDGSPVPALQLSGIDYRNGSVIGSLGSADAVSSLTIQPLSGLRFGVHYTIQATSGIKDLDNVADPTKPALSLIQPASPIGFTTVGPQLLGGTEPFSSTRVVVMGDRAYVAKQENTTLSFVHAYDLTDPSNPTEVNIGTAAFIGRAQDTAGEENAPVIGGDNLLAVGAGVGAFDFGLPSNLWLYNVSGDQIQRVGAVSVTGSTVNEGQLLRVTLHGNFAYSGTYPLGIQVVDLQQAITEYNDVFTHDPTQFGQQITTDGEGFARDAVVNTIPINDASGHHYMVFGIQAGEFLVPGSDPDNPVTKTYVVSAGVVPGSIPNTISFVVADPTSSSPPAYADILRLDSASLDSGRAVALGQLTDSVLDANGNSVQKPVAVAVGLGTASDPAIPGSLGPGGVLAVVDMTNPTSPQVLSMIKVPASPIDVVLYGTTALIGTGENKVLLVKLTDPRQPLFAGEIDGSFGDRLAVTPDGLLVTSSLNATIGGIQTADLTGTRQPHPNARPNTGHVKHCEDATGLPIDLTNGNVYVDQSDYSLPGLGGGIQLSRTWNSSWESSTPVEIAGTFGNSWRSTYDERLVIPAGTAGSAPIKYWLSDGTAWFFQPSSSGSSYTVSSPLDEHATLQADATQTSYIITFAAGTKKIFNNNGYLIGILDRNGNRTTVSYDTTNRITNVTDAAGRVLTFNYGSTRQVQSVQDAVGVIATYTYDTAARLTKVVYADGSSVSMSYDPTDLLLNVTDSNGKILEAHTYDSARRGLTSARANGVDSVTVEYLPNGQTQVTSSQNAITIYGSGSFGGRSSVNSITGPGCSSCGGRNNSKFSYDVSGNRTSSADALGRTTTYKYDSQGNTLSTSMQVGSSTITWAYTYNNFGELLTVTDPMGNTTQNAYDSNGNLLTVTSPPPGAGVPASVTQYTYNSLGELTKVTDPMGNGTTLTYTSAGLLATITDAQKNVTTYTYDARGNRTAVTDILNNTSRLAYDALSRLTKLTYPDSTTTQFSYDSRGRRTSTTDQNGGVTIYSYDDADRLISATDPGGKATTYTYDAENQLTAITDANSSTTSLSYDSLGRLIQLLFPSGLMETYGYDSIGNLTNKTDRKNQTIKYSYDELDRLIQKIYPDNTAINYSYNNDSRLTQVADPTGTYQFAFDNLGRLTSTTTQYSFLPGRSITTSYAYDLASNRVGFTDPEGASTTYAYDSLKRLTALSSSTVGQFTFGYDALSRTTQVTRPNNITTKYSYDGLSRLVSVLHQAGGSNIDGASYTVDAAGNRATRIDQRTGVTTNYSYDPTYQLIGVTQDGAVTERYTYDSVGNRLGALNSTGWTYNNSNQLISTPSASYTYDKNGNVLTKIDSTGEATYMWDFDNRLTSVSLLGDNITFKYDPFGHRIYKSSSSGTHIYIYDGADIVETLDGNGGKLALFTMGPGVDQPLALTQAGSTSYFEVDELNSITSLTNSAGNLTDTYNYDSFGNSVSSDGTTDNPFRFTGREFDRETGLYYYRARYYEPQEGRFISEDPVGFTGDRNFYRYAENSPVNENDPSGYWGTDAHNQLIRNALSPCGVSDHDIKQIQRGSRHADDFKFQGAEYSYMHSMTNGSSNPPQSAADMMQQRDAFVAAQMANAQSQLQGNRDNAMFDFGFAIHPLMDQTSPAHVDPQGNPIPWCGLNPFGCSQFSQHGDTPWSKENLKALNARPDVQQRENIIIRSYYESLTGQKLPCNNCGK